MGFISCLPIYLHLCQGDRDLTIPSRPGIPAPSVASLGGVAKDAGTRDVTSPPIDVAELILWFHKHSRYLRIVYWKDNQYLQDD